MRVLAERIEEDSVTDRDGPIQPFRLRKREQDRIASLFGLIPERGDAALDVGARDGYLSQRLCGRFRKVAALDLARPGRVPQGPAWIIGNAARLPFPDRSFDLVLCSEVLEHLSEPLLSSVCRELRRVTRRHLVIGVPYGQDLRLGRTTCRRCGGRNPPYGHVNAFREPDLDRRFPGMRAERIEKPGIGRERTNALSALLYDWAGNPYGTYDQDEPCLRCGALPILPPETGLAGRMLAAAAVRLQLAQSALAGPRPLWIHVRYGFPPGG